MRLLSLTSMMWLRASDWVSFEFGLVTSGRIPLHADNTSPRRTESQPKPRQLTVYTTQPRHISTTGVDLRYSQNSSDFPLRSTKYTVNVQYSIVGYCVPYRRTYLNWRSLVTYSCLYTIVSDRLTCVKNYVMTGVTGVIHHCFSYSNILCVSWRRSASTSKEPTAPSSDSL